VIIVDLGLPPSTESAFCRQIRLWARARHVVMADGSEDSMVRALDEGACDTSRSSSRCPICSPVLGSESAIATRLSLGKPPPPPPPPPPPAPPPPALDRSAAQPDMRGASLRRSTRARHVGRARSWICRRKLFSASRSRGRKWDGSSLQRPRPARNCGVRTTYEYKRGTVAVSSVQTVARKTLGEGPVSGSRRAGTAATLDRTRRGARPSAASHDAGGRNHDRVRTRSD